jgi:hypothetical protein
LSARRSALRGACALTLAAAIAAACGGQKARFQAPARPSLISELTALPAFVTPAEWRYHPPEPARILAELELSGGDKLLAGRRGERWLSSRSKRRLEAASALAPENLVGILRAPAGGFSFVGESGVSYEARSPLAAFHRSSAPLEPLTSVTSSGRAILGIRRDRGLLRSPDGGATWQPVGPAEPKFVSVLLGEDDFGVALAAPEALFSSADGGVTFERLLVPSIGAFALERLPEGRIGIVSALGLHQLQKGSAPALVRATAGSKSAAPDYASPRGPSGAALSEGRAYTTGKNYFELAFGERTSAWLLVSGPLEGPLTTRAVPELSGCRAVKLAGFERALTAACFRAGAESATQPIELLTSEDAGQTFSGPRFTLDGSLLNFRMAAGADGALLLTGVCAPHQAGSGCAAQGVLRRKLGQSQSSGAPRRNKPSGVVPSATPSLAEVALALAFSANGRVAYAIGRRTKGGALSAFVSRDGGKSFEAEELALPAADDSEGEERWDRSAAGIKVEALVPAEDGSVGVSVTRYRSRYWLVLDENARVISVAEPPEPRALVGVAGSRALSLSLQSGEVWESLDAGATFRSLGQFPIDLCPEEQECQLPLACTPLGCALGNDISRVGWGAREEDDIGMLTPPPAPSVDYSVPQLKTPLSCQLDPTPWQGLEGMDELPVASNAAIGKAVWFGAGSDPARASAWVWVAYAGGKRRVEREPLLAPSERGRSYAMTVSSQVEGVAALRYITPDSSSPAPHLTAVELSWLNFLEERKRRATLADGGAYAPGDFSRGPRGAQIADPALLSIAEGGIYLRLHRAAGDNQATLYFDGQRVERTPALSWPATGVKGTRSEMAHLDGRHVPLLMLGRGSALVRARFEGGQTYFDAFATGALDPARFGTMQFSNIAYQGSRAGLVIETFDSALARADANLFLFRATGDVVDAPIPVPTQFSLPEKPQRCDASVQASTPRAVAPHHPGTRHPVIINDGSDMSFSFITAYAVLHGTPQAPCVAAFDAEPLLPEGAEASGARAILPFGDLQQSYLFRSTTQNQVVKVEYRTMSCRFDPAAEVPPELYRAPGALVPRTR